MIIVMKPDADAQSIQRVTECVREKGLDVHISEGSEITVIGVIGDRSRIDRGRILGIKDVEKIVNVTESYKLAGKKFQPEPTSIVLPHTTIGPGHMALIAGPCAVESEEQIMTTARKVKSLGATLLRGGAFKPRTSPYSFQGLELEGLKLMKQASIETGLDTVCEVTSERALEMAVDYVDMLQVGARNMQNFELLKEIGKSGKPVVLKRGLSATIDEWLNAAEYILVNGNPHVVLCERGIRTFETATRNTLDLSAVCVLREKTHLPVIVDPSHATGKRSCVAPLAKAAAIAGADGVMIEVHPNPACALSDGPQSLNFIQFEQFAQEFKPIVDLTGRTLA